MANKPLGMTTHLTWGLEQVGVSESRAQAEDVVTLGVLGNGLHDGSVDND